MRDALRHELMWTGTNLASLHYFYIYYEKYAREIWGINLDRLPGVYKKCVARKLYLDTLRNAGGRSYFKVRVVYNIGGRICF